MYDNIMLYITLFYCRIEKKQRVHIGYQPERYATNNRKKKNVFFSFQIFLNKLDYKYIWLLHLF